MHAIYPCFLFVSFFVLSATSHALEGIGYMGEDHGQPKLVDCDELGQRCTHVYPNRMSDRAVIPTAPDKRIKQSHAARISGVLDAQKVTDGQAQKRKGNRLVQVNGFQDLFAANFLSHKNLCSLHLALNSTNSDNTQGSYKISQTVFPQSSSSKTENCANQIVTSFLLAPSDKSPSLHIQFVLYGSSPESCEYQPVLDPAVTSGSKGDFKSLGGIREISLSCSKQQIQ